MTDLIYIFCEIDDFCKDDAATLSISCDVQMTKCTGISYMVLPKIFFGKLFGDKGYHVRPEVREKIEKNNISIFTKSKKNLIAYQMREKKPSIESFVGTLLPA